MKLFQFDVTRENEKTILSLSGSMDENMKLPDLNVDSTTLVIDFNEVNFINSLGIRTWLSWIDNLNFPMLEMRRLRPAIVEQANLIMGFLPHNTVVSSIYAPWYCEDCDTEELILLENEKDYFWESGVIIEGLSDERQCNNCGSTSELDRNPKLYFHFILNNKKAEAA